MKSFNNQFSNYNKTVEKKKTQYSALLGMSETVIEHPTRPGFCYARMADNLSELIVVFNDKVSQAYNLPVLVERRGQVWYVVGRDAARYSNWGTSVPFLPKHAEQHEFNREVGTGADTVFVYPDQFMPLLCYPSGTLGSGNILVAPYILQTTDDFLYVGNTGTRNVLIYKPTGSNAIMGLVYLDKTTGNPDVLIASGTPFANTITGSSQIAQYIPYPSANQEPLYAFRLVSGTSSILWENLYNVRQFIGGSSSTGSSGGGGTIPTFITGSVPFSGDDGILTENNPQLFWNNTDGQLWVGGHAPPVAQNQALPLVLVARSQNIGVGAVAFAYGTGTSGSPAPAFNGYRARGTLEPLSFEPVQNGDALVSILGNGYDGANFSPVARLRAYADGDFVTGTSTPSRWDFDTTPTGSTTRETAFSVHGNNVDIMKGLKLTGILTPPMVTGSQINYNPTGIDSATVLRIDLNANRQISGIVGGTNGRILVLSNISSSFTITLQDENGSSADIGNKIECPDNLSSYPVPPNTDVVLRYDGIQQYWRIIIGGVVAKGSITGGDVAGFDSNVTKNIRSLGTPASLVASVGDGLYQATGTTIPNNGWNSVPFTVNYVSADSPSFVINVQGNVTGTYEPGVKWKLGHLGTTKYFFQTGLPSYVSGAYTSINLYGGTDYTLTTGTISSPQISRIKAPSGFPLSPVKWSVVVSDTSAPTKASPTANTWYGHTGTSPTAPSISIPIGDWYIEYGATEDIVITLAAVGIGGMRITLSTSNTSESDASMSKSAAQTFPIVTGGLFRQAFVLSPMKILNLSSKTTYYLLMYSTSASATSIYFAGNLFTTVISARCAYL